MTLKADTHIFIYLRLTSVKVQVLFILKLCFFSKTKQNLFSINNSVVISR